ncbi:hypothetical protein [Actinophytocola oryzae]|uniref:AAA+ ATPase domain-containing protein n=1 Tax=Actinophytocola oryzae TaxID=502181 RepID=A0A4R7V611_9PSEU|nr:hypothetical protein [Actinophytocola oryzae]TDV44869.1 hypothetical protein CLV71_113128 [Actinophytocola oryzae]
MRFLRRWWSRLRGWWVLTAAAAAAAVLSAVARLYTGTTAAVAIAVGLAVVGVLADRGRTQLSASRPAPGLLITRVDRLTDPLRLGVHRAAALEGDQVPPFVPRDLLPEFVAALGRGGFVLVVGDSTAGKTRLAYEAMRLCLPRHVCVAPDGPDTLRAALGAAKVNRPSVLWLDDLDRYLGVGGLTRTDMPNTLVLATMRTHERERLSHRNDAARNHLDRRLARAGRELLDVVTTEIHLDRMWTERELSAAADNGDPRIARAVVAAERHGIAEQLAAGPELARELRDALDTRARGAALVTAAIDLRRAGCHRPVPLEVLRTLHESYLRPGVRPEPWEAALAWATEPLHATSSLLEPVPDGYLAFDYLLDRTDPIPDAVWTAIVEFASPVELLEVAAEAAFVGKHDFLRAGYAKALAHEDFMVAAQLAEELGSVGFDEEAVELLGALVAAAGDAITDEQRLRIGHMRIWLTGQVFGGRGEPERAFAMARELVAECIELYGATAVDTLQARLIMARNTSDPEEALRESRAVMADATRHLGAGHGITFQARFEEAVWVREVEGPEEAAGLYQALLDDADNTTVAPGLYVDAQWNLGGSLLSAGEARGAAAVLEVAVENALLLNGPDHVATFEIQLTYLRALDADNRVDDALELAGQLAQNTERVLGHDHPTTAEAWLAVDRLTDRRA